MSSLALTCCSTGKKLTLKDFVVEVSINSFLTGSHRVTSKTDFTLLETVVKLVFANTGPKEITEAELEFPLPIGKCLNVGPVN
jgi:hypothetical protein